MAKGTVYITARSAEPKDVYDAVAGWTAGFDTLDDAKAHGLTLSQKAYYLIYRLFLTRSISFRYEVFVIRHLNLMTLA